MKKCNQCINAAGRQDLVEGKIICRCEKSVYNLMPVEDIPEVDCKDFEEADVNKWAEKWIPKRNGPQPQKQQEQPKQ